MPKISRSIGSNEDLARRRGCETQHRHAPRSLSVAPSYCPCLLKGEMVHRCWITMCAWGRRIAGSVHPAAPENLVYNHGFILCQAQCDTATNAFIANLLNFPSWISWLSNCFHKSVELVADYLLFLALHRGVLCFSPFLDKMSQNHSKVNLLLSRSRLWYASDFLFLLCLKSNAEHSVYSVDRL